MGCLSPRFLLLALLFGFRAGILEEAAGQDSLIQLQQTVPGERVRTEIPYQDGTVVLLSDFQERITKTRYRAKGHVEITFQDNLVTSDEAEYDEVTREGFTRGPTRFSHDTQWLTCSRAEFNFSNQTGTFYDATGFTDNEFLIKGRTIIKTGRDTYRVEGSFMTACPEKLPKWSFSSSSAKIRVDHTARMRQTIFRIKGVPVLYFPYIILPMEKKERSSGFLPFHTGNSTSKGRVFSLGYFQTLGQSADVTIYGDYFTERGLALGTIFRARPNPRTRLYFQAYGIKDRLNQGGTQIMADGESLLSNGFRAVAKINITSSFQFRQAFSDTFRSATIPLDNSVLYLTKNQGSYSTNISFERDEVRFPERTLVLRRFPSVQFSSLGQPLGKTPLIFYLDTALDGLSRSDRYMKTPSVVQRLDLFPRLGIRLPAFLGFSLLPTVGIRETYYGARTGDRPDSTLVSDSLHRQYTQFELDLRTPTLEKRFDSSWAGKFKHVIEPTIFYRRIHGVDNLNETIRFDDQDAIADTNEVAAGIVNRIFRSRENALGTSQDYEFLSLSLIQKYYFDPTFGGAFLQGESNNFYPLNTYTGFSVMGIQRNLAPTNIILRIAPASGISYDIRADLDSHLQRMRDASLSMYWHRDKIFAAGTYFRTEALEAGEASTYESHQVQGQVGYGSPLRGFSASVTISYNIYSATLLNSHSRINYMWDCCGVSLEFQQFDLGSRTESRINFSFNLKGLGRFGNIKRPEALF